MERKKFEIRPNAPRKRFIIFDPHPPKKTFKIREEPLASNPEWFQQTNTSDCGPCLILNGLRNIENARHLPGSIAQVRQEINQLRHKHNLAELAPHAWFASYDIHAYLREIADLKVTEYPCFDHGAAAEDISGNIRADLEREPFQMVYFTTGSHFRGIIPTNTGYVLLDSFNDGPEMVDADRVNTLISESIAQSTPSRVERVGVVRGNQPEQS